MISIIIPLYNKEKTIARAIDSILNQSFHDWECVVVDDGSFDSSSSIVKSYADSRIRYIYQKNKGVSSARNKGVENAKGDWIVFLDADDVFLGDALQILYGMVTKNRVKCAAGNFYIQTGTSCRLYSAYNTGIIKNAFREWYRKNFCPRTGSAIFSKKILQAFPFDEKLQRYEDAQSLFDIMRQYPFAYNQQPVMIYMDDNKSLSNKCLNPLCDFIFNMNFTNKSFWEKIVLLHLLNEGFYCYPQNKDVLKNKYHVNLFYLKMEKIFFRLTIFMSKIKNLFYEVKC